MRNSRKYISVYFADSKHHGRKKGDITLAFSRADGLFARVKNLGSAEIKRIIRIDDYQALVRTSMLEDRTTSNLIKHRLREHFANEEKNPIS